MIKKSRIDRAQLLQLLELTIILLKKSDTQSQSTDVLSQVSKNINN